MRLNGDIILKNSDSNCFLDKFFIFTLGIEEFVGAIVDSYSTKRIKLFIRNLESLNCNFISVVGQAYAVIPQAGIP